MKMKSIYEMNDRELEFFGLLTEANAAKDRLANIAEKLQAAGFSRKAKSCMTLVYQIEAWQNRG